MGLKSSGGGEIVQVQGGHIIRATGRKDRHSKVFTAKGPRDRRVRLSAHTAIQFYDVQDRLGYDRPSKAVDWLINKAKASIDKLAELPPWDPIAVNNASHGATVETTDLGASANNHHQISVAGDPSGGPTQFYVPQCVDSQSLADSMKSFFPTNNTSGETSISFQNYPHELISRGSTLSQDLCLSLHTLQDPGASGSGHQPHSGHDRTVFQGSGSMPFDAGWAQQQDMARFTRLMGWAGYSGSGSSGSGGGGEGRGAMLCSINNPSQLSSAQALLLGQQGSSATTAAYNSQRGTLQSSYSPLIRAFEDHPHHHQAPHNQSHISHSHHHHHHSISSLGHGSDSFMGFYIPSQIQGDMHGGSGTASMSNRASSSSLSPDSSTH